MNPQERRLAQAAWEAWETSFIKAAPPDFAKNLRIFEALYEEALALGIFPPPQPLQGLEEKIHLAEALNVSATDRNPGPGAG